MTSHSPDGEEAPLLGTFITSVADRNVDCIHQYYQGKDGSLLRLLHKDLDKKIGHKIPFNMRTIMKMHSPLASVFAIDRDRDIPEARVYAQNTDNIVIQKVPTDRAIVGAAEGTKFSAAYDGNNVYIQYQKTGFENEIFEKNLTDGTEKSVCHHVLPGTNISTVETSIRPKPLSSDSVAPADGGSVAPPDGGSGRGVGICRYMVYTGTERYLYFNFIDHEPKPEIERVRSLKPTEMWPNTPIALAPVIDKLAIYFLNKSGQISRVDRGDYGWGVPKVVGGDDIKPHPGTNLAAENDMSQGEREVWVSYQDKDGVIRGFHDTVGGA